MEICDFRTIHKAEPNIISTHPTDQPPSQAMKSEPRMQALETAKNTNPQAKEPKSNLHLRPSAVKNS